MRAPNPPPCRLLLLYAASLGACAPDLGVCDPAAAERVVYDDGTPAYEGQALVIQSCGAGAFCHSEGIDATDRFGVPRGLDFDLRLASTTPDVEAPSIERLGRSQANAHFLATSVYEQVRRGAMPPPGVTAVPIGRPEYQRVAPGEREGPVLPGIATEEGLAILRNWLACQAPVVERTLPRADGNENTVGGTAATIETTPVDPVWSAIYPRIVERSCAYTMCHDATTQAGALDLSTPARALEALLQPAAGRLCESAGIARVVPGDPDASLLVHKLRGVGPDGRVCGSRMPSAGSYLSESRIETITTWIANGARAE
ncbi:MAG: hypothetical protein KF729_10975 [Sandaracinaceae bacterium]|nr:hypothetical protein [Sandaracinaceae bacterium]